MIMTASVNRTSIAIGNSEHPVGKLVTSLLARPVPNRTDLWYVRTVSDKVTITYRPFDQSLCFYPFGFDVFKEHIKMGTLPHAEAVDIPENSKYIGSTILAELRDLLSA